MKTCAISGDIDGVERFLEQFRLHAEHLQEVIDKACFCTCTV